MRYRQPRAMLCCNRRSILIAASGYLFLPPYAAMAAAQAGSEERFKFLSANGNSNCSAGFLESIASMPETARLQGSCCGPMSLHHYKEQVDGLREYANYPEVPPDPYDIEAGFAAIMLKEYKAELGGEQLATYNAAMEKSDEGGPCCCKCWRWEVLGGMGKVLIRQRQAGSKTVAKIWDLTNGCGGDSHVH